MGSTSGSLHHRHQSSSSHAAPPSSSQTLPTTTHTLASTKDMISPRSGNYERLEGGLGPSRLGMRNFAWKKLAIGVVAVVGLVWVLTPSNKIEGVLGGLKPGMGWKVSGWKGKGDTDVDYRPLPPPPSITEVTHVPTTPRPTSPESDPDPLKTVHCTSPYKPGAPLVQYALMIDAGSTGSRIHIYKFHNCGPTPTYEYEVFRQTRPGLSSADFAGDPQMAAQSLDKLLDVAVSTVPETLQSCTPVAVKATAGLRLLGPEQSSAILAAVRERLRTAYPFPLAPGEPVTIMDGKDEGVYAWITSNYLLDTIRADSAKGALPYAVLDLGGASTQIVFEPMFDSARPDAALEEGEHKYELKFGEQTHVLYQHSYLGYGLMMARRSVHGLVDFMASLRTHDNNGEIGNPCLSQGTRREVEVERPGDKNAHRSTRVMMVGEDIGGFESCNRVMELVMAKDSICEKKPCSFDGVYQPSLLETFPNGKVLLLSYFYDRINPLIANTTPPPKLTVSTLADLAKDVCLGQPSWEKRWGKDAAVMEDLKSRPEYCLDLTFMHALLRLGYEFDGDREVVIGKKIEDTELGWALGAAITLVGGELTCKV